MPNPAMAPYSVSASAAPKPERRPDLQPFSRVRSIQSTLTGPTGAEMIRPTAKPRMGNPKSIIMALDSGRNEPGGAAPSRIRTIFQDPSFNRQSLQTRLHYAHVLIHL